MEEIQNFLAEDEEILWKRSEIKNLLSPIPFAIYGGLITNAILFLFVIIIIIYIEWVFAIIGYVVGIICFNVFYIWFNIMKYKQIKNNLQMSHSELKKYSEFEVITNKRYIRKIYSLNFNRDFLKYSKRTIKRANDIIFLDLGRIQKIHVSHVINKIFLLVNINKGDTNFYINFQNDEANKIIKALTEIRKEIPVYDKKKFEQ